MFLYGRAKHLKLYKCLLNIFSNKNVCHGEYMYINIRTIHLSFPLRSKLSHISYTKIPTDFESETLE